MLDSDLADLYGVQTKVLNQAVRRNIGRFPEDFAFELSEDEQRFLRSQFVTLENPGRGKYSKYPPLAFTEQGIAMLASVLKSQKAIEVNIAIVRAFVQLRQMLEVHQDLAAKIQNLEKKYEGQFRQVFQAIHEIIRTGIEKPRKKIKTISE